MAKHSPLYVGRVLLAGVAAAVAASVPVYTNTHGQPNDLFLIGAALNAAFTVLFWRAPFYAPKAGPNSFLGTNAEFLYLLDSLFASTQFFVMGPHSGPILLFLLGIKNLELNEISGGQLGKRVIIGGGLIFLLCACWATLSPVSFWATHRMLAIEAVGALGFAHWIAFMHHTRMNYYNVKTQRNYEKLFRIIKAKVHEAKSPLSTVAVWNFPLLSDPGTVPEERKRANETVRSTAQLEDFLNEIQDLTDIETNGPLASPKAFDLHRVVNDTLDNIREATLGVTGTHLSWTIDPHLSSHITSDPGRITQFLKTLVGNALKHTRDGNIQIRIALSTRAHGDSPSIMSCIVTDSGEGVPEEFRPYLFLRDRPENKVVGKRALGLSYGLYFVASAARAMGGDVDFRPHPIRGSIFTVKVPIELNEESGTFTSLKEASALVVNSPPEARGFLTSVMRRSGASYGSADTLQNATERLRDGVEGQQPYTSVILFEKFSPTQTLQEINAIRSAISPSPQIIVVARHGAVPADLRHYEELGSHVLPSLSDEVLVFRLLRASISRRKNSPRFWQTTFALKLERQTGKRTRVLIADDDELHRAAIASVLPTFDTRFACSCEEMLRNLAETDFDLVIFDIVMPDGRGIDVYARYLEGTTRRHPASAIVLSADGAAMVNEGARLGITQFLSKPLRIPYLLEAVDNVLSARSRSMMH